jgi:hypothetical protein
MTMMIMTRSEPRCLTVRSEEKSTVDQNLKPFTWKFCALADQKDFTTCREQQQ